MRAQYYYPYDSLILGLNNDYQTIGDDSFFVNAPSFILATDQILTIGKEYVIFDTAKETGIKLSDVILNDCYYYEGLIHLIVQDIRSLKVFTIEQCLECPESDCTWILVDIDYFHDLMDTKVVRDYCGCDENKKRPNGDIASKMNEDLLEFEF